MFKKIFVVFVFCLLCIFFVYADEDVTIDIGGDLELVYDTVHTVQSNIECVSGTVASKIERYIDDVRQYEWTGYTFTATSPFQLRTLLTCFPSGVTWFDNIAVSIKAPTISAWSDSSVSPNTTVWLMGVVSGTPCTTFDYQWEQISGPVVEISNSWQFVVNSSTYDSASFIFPDTTENIVMKLLVTPQSCYHWGNTYSGIVTYSKLFSGWWSWWWWGSSYSSRMRDEAQRLFYDTWSIEKIHLILNINEYPSFPFLQIYRNSIGWNWQVYYILEYSTWSSFNHYLKFETTQLSYDFWKTHLDPEAMVHYFRVKAGYMWKLSSYSNIFTYYSEDYIDISCPRCKEKINYDDVMIDEDVILDWLLDIECKTCKQHVIK